MSFWPTKAVVTLGATLVNLEVTSSRRHNGRKSRSHARVHSHNCLVLTLKSRSQILQSRSCDRSSHNGCHKTRIERLNGSLRAMMMPERVWSRSLTRVIGERSMRISSALTSCGQLKPFQSTSKMTTTACKRKTLSSLSLSRTEPF